MVFCIEISPACDDELDCDSLAARNRATRINQEWIFGRSFIPVS